MGLNRSGNWTGVEKGRSAARRVIVSQAALGSQIR